MTKNSSGFTLIEIVLVFILIGLIATLTLPFFFNSITKISNKKKLSTIILTISELRKKSISYLEYGEIIIDNNEILFFLGGKLYKKISVPFVEMKKNKIVFNKNGYTNGGEIILKTERTFRLIIKKFNGKIELR